MLSIQYDATCLRCADGRAEQLRSCVWLNSLPLSSLRLLLVLLGWAAVAYLVQRIANTAANSSHTIYDPFSILGIAASATEKEIKKHYKRLSVKL